MFAEGNPEYIHRGVHLVPAEFQGLECFREVPLGKGSVDFPKGKIK